MNIFTNEIIFPLILSYLSFIDLFLLSLSSLYFYNNNKYLEDYFYFYVKKKFLLRKDKIKNNNNNNNNNKLCLKKYGIYSWKYTFIIWTKEMKIPYGKYMPRNQYCFGKIKEKLINCWLYLQHTPDSVLLLNQLNLNYSIGNIRICLQNDRDNSIYINLSNSFEVRSKSQKNIGFETIPIMNTSLTAFNGLSISDYLNSNDNTIFTHNSSVLKLDQYEFAVFTLKVICPEGIRHEIDLLSSLRSVCISLSQSEEFINISPKLINDQNSNDEKVLISEQQPESTYSTEISLKELKISENDDNNHNYSSSDIFIEIPVYDEDILWNSYEMTPGGVILLKDVNTMISDK